MDQLIDGEYFYSRYLKTCELLAQSQQMRCTVRHSVIDKVHCDCFMEVISSLKEQQLDGTDPRFYILVLGIVARHLCTNLCVEYESYDEGVNHAPEHRNLLLQYPLEYTAMEFIRDLHWDIYFYRSTVVRAARLPALTALDADTLQTIFAQIRDSPGIAARYPDLLGLIQ